MVVQYEKGLHWVADSFLQTETSRRQICYRQPFTQRNCMVFLFQYPSKKLVKFANTLKYSSNSKISLERDWKNSKSIIYILDYFSFQNCGLEVTKDDISNIDGIETVIEQRYQKQPAGMFY